MSTRVSKEFVCVRMGNLIVILVDCNCVNLSECQHLRLMPIFLMMSDVCVLIMKSDVCVLMMKSDVCVDDEVRCVCVDNEVRCVC